MTKQELRELADKPTPPLPDQHGPPKITDEDRRRLGQSVAAQQVTEEDRRKLAQGMANTARPLLPYESRYKPTACPFCGGPAGTYERGGLWFVVTATGWRVRCKVCGVQSPSARTTEEEAIEVWNYRVNQP